MAIDPRAFSVKPCPKGQQLAISQQNTRRTFFSQLGKIGDLEVLNDIKGADKVGKGLRLLSSVSNSVRTGKDGALPTVIGQSIDSGANWVLNAMGMDSNTLAGLNRLQPGIANQAYGQAKVIYQDIKAGKFSVDQIPFYLQNFQNLERLIRNIFVPNGNNKQALKQICEASPYAVDLVSTKSPKYKWLFVVEFVFNGSYSAAMKGVNETFAFTVQTATRPDVKYEMEEVNMYNYRTQIIKRTSFTDMKMTFFDDQNNVALDFYNAYMKSTVPITNIRTPTEAEAQFDEGGMAFTRQLGAMDSGDDGISLAMFPRYAGSWTPPVMEDAGKNILREIKLFEVFDWGRRFNVYRYLNPRISQLSLDDMDMTASNGIMMFNLDFNYDSVAIVTNQDMSAMASNRTGESPGDPKTLTKNGLYPLHYVGQQTTPGSTADGSGISKPTIGNILGKGTKFLTPGTIPDLQGQIPQQQGDYPTPNYEFQLSAPQPPTAPTDLSSAIAGAGGDNLGTQFNADLNALPPGGL